LVEKLQEKRRNCCDVDSAKDWSRSCRGRNKLQLNMEEGKEMEHRRSNRKAMNEIDCLQNCTRRKERC
jgi:hypothetical protein